MLMCKQGKAAAVCIQVKITWLYIILNSFHIDISWWSYLYSGHCFLVDCYFFVDETKSAPFRLGWHFAFVLYGSIGHRLGSAVWGCNCRALHSLLILSDEARVPKLAHRVFSEALVVVMSTNPALISLADISIVRCAILFFVATYEVGRILFSPGCGGVNICNTCSVCSILTRPHTLFVGCLCKSSEAESML